RIAAGARPRPASYSWPLLEWWRAAAAAAPVEAAGAVVEAAEVGAQLLLSPQPSQSRAPAQPTTSSTRRRSCSPSNSLSPGTPPESRRFGIGILIGALLSAFSRRAGLHLRPSSHSGGAAGSASLSNLKWLC